MTITKEHIKKAVKDKYEFEVWDVQITSTFEDGGVNAEAESEDGRLWFGVNRKGIITGMGTA